MKKLSLYIFLVLMWCNVGFAEVYYCSEFGSTGFLPNHNGGYKTTNFNLQKFKAKIDFENKSYESKDSDFLISSSQGEGCIGSNWVMTCYNTIGDTIRLSKEDDGTVKFAQSYLYGWTGKYANQISVSYGTCEKF